MRHSYRLSCSVIDIRRTFSRVVEWNYARGIILDPNVSGLSAASNTDDLRRRCRAIAELLNECEGEAALWELRADLSLIATRLGAAVARLVAPIGFAIEVELARSELAALKSEMALARRQEATEAVQAHLRTALGHAFETITWVERVGERACDRTVNVPAGAERREGCVP